MPALLAIGAHYDDCVFGVPGVLLRAVARGYRVVVATLIDDYANFPPAAGREAALKAGTIALARERDVDLRFLPLGFRSLTIQESDAARVALAQVVAEVRPDVGLLLWPHDRHADHGPASRLSEVALRHPGTLLGDRSVVPVPRLYAYDNGPRHTVGFEPDTYVDVSAEWPAAVEWLGRLMALMRGQPYDPAARDLAVQLKETLARYRGAACGVRYAEALRSLAAYPQDVL